MRYATVWANKFVFFLTVFCYFPIPIVAGIAGMRDGDYMLTALCVPLFSYYALLCVWQLSARVQLKEDGIYLTTVFSSSFVEYTQLIGVDAEEWGGSVYLIGTWPLPIKVPVLILHSGDKKYLRRAFGPPSHVYKVLNEISVKAGLAAVPVPHTRSRGKPKGQEKYVPKRAARKERT